MKIKLKNETKQNKERKTKRQIMDTLLSLIKFLITFCVFKLSIMLETLLFGICFLATN